MIEFECFLVGVFVGVPTKIRCKIFLVKRKFL